MAAFSRSKAISAAVVVEGLERTGTVVMIVAFVLVLVIVEDG